MNLELTIPDERLREMDALRERLGIKTAAELINNALTLMEWAVEETAAGRSIAAVDEAGGAYRELQMPVLAALRPSGGFIAVLCHLRPPHPEQGWFIGPEGFVKDRAQARVFETNEAAQRVAAYAWADVGTGWRIKPLDDASGVEHPK